MMEEFTRDFAMTAAILGLFAFAWFGWAQQDPPKKKYWPILLGIGSGLSFLVATAGALLAWQNWDGPTRIVFGEGFTDYMMIFIIEFIAIALAIIILLVTKKSRYLPTAVSFIVGVHFFPLAPVFYDNGLYLLAAVVTLASLLPLVLANRLNISLVTLTCVSVGLCLFVFALRGLLMAIV